MRLEQIFYSNGKYGEMFRSVIHSFCVIKVFVLTLTWIVSCIGGAIYACI